MSTATATKEQTNGTKAVGEQLPAIAKPRLPFHPAIEERFGVDKSSWKALVEAVFPNATTVDSVILALSYCKARNLDPFKRNVHIVPIWNKELGRMVDTIWPGIGELRTTAFRTGCYAGRGATVCGPDITQKVGKADMTYPEWMQVTVKRLVKGIVVDFAGPRVYWKETYATYKRDDDTPNDMWLNRPRGQLEKCAEAAALRAAFPEEIGGDCIPDELERSHGPAIDVTPTKRGSQLDQLTQRIERQPEPEEQSPGELTALAFPDFLTAVEACTGIGSPTRVLDVTNKSGWTEEERAEAVNVVNAREEALKPKRGPRATKQEQLIS